MNNKNNKFLYLVWKHPKTRRNYTIGKLEKGEGYTFEYCEEYLEAQQDGLPLMDTFPEQKCYKSSRLFPVFSSRLPDPKRRDIATVLQKYNMTEFDEFELLRRSGGRLPIDTYEFIDPIFPEDKTIERIFYVMGIRHKTLCQGVDCSKIPDVNIGDEVRFVLEPDNEKDPNAIIIETLNGQYLGYVPRYYNQAIIKRLENGESYACVVTEINRDMKCSECIKVKLNIPRT